MLLDVVFQYQARHLANGVVLVFQCVENVHQVVVIIPVYIGREIGLQEGNPWYSAINFSVKYLIKLVG